MIQYLTTSKLIADISDADPLAAHHRTTDAPNDEDASRLLAEIERRHLDL